MSSSSAPSAKPLFAGLLALFVIVAIFFVMYVFAWLKTIAIIALVVLGLYEGYRLLALMQGRTPPPSALGLVRGAGRILWKGVRALPAVARWTGRTAHLVAHSTHEIATGAVFGGLIGLAVGWHYGFLFTGAFLGLVGGGIGGALVGRRRLRASGTVPPTNPAAQSQNPES